MGSGASGVREWLVACVFCLGFWQLAQGTDNPARAWLAQERMLRAWDRARHGSADPAPWPWSDTWPVARLSARHGSVELIVLAGATGRTLAFGPGHLSASSLPGQPGNTVIVGHGETYFSFLRDIEPGDPIILETARGQRHLYEVVGMDVVDSRRGSLILDTETPMLSLVTRYPFEAYRANASMRYVVTAKMVF